ncbi:MAG: HNH endonuclease [Bacteriovoracia bacterium]
MNLTHLTDLVLLADTKKLASKEREMTLKVLHHLKEIDKRKLYSDLKYRSLYEYCLMELKYSEGSAIRRIVAARLLNELPEIELKIVSGDLSLMNISSGVKFIKENNIKNLKGKKSIFSKLEGLSKKECDQTLFLLSGKERPKTTTLTILDETYVLIEKARDLLGNNIGHDELIQRSIEKEIANIERSKFKIRKVRNSPPPVAKSRVISAKTKRNVYKRDKKCVNCGSIHNLNYDHIIPYAMGGKSEESNIRLLCFNCNQRHRIRSKL